MSNSIYPIISIACFVAAIIFYRRKDVPISRVIPFIIQSMMTPSKLNEVFEREGIWLIISGFIVFISYIVFT